MRGALRVRRGGRITLACLAVLVVAWLVACYVVVARPSVDHPTRADAIMVLGPPTANGRLQTALSLVDQQVAKNLVISLNSPKQWQARVVCQHPPAGVTVTCFQPDPATTRGEAEQARRLAQQHGWTNVVVVTSIYHISRARMIFDRCLGGVQMVAARRGVSLGTWAYQFLYQTAAFVKAAAQPGC